MKKNKSQSAKADRMREEFLGHVRAVANYWASLPKDNPIDVARGVAFSILVALDGEACACGPFAVRPIDERGKEGPDIAGSLHEDRRLLGEKRRGSDLFRFARWIPVAAEKPDADTTVLICNPKWIEPVALGYLDGEVWRDAGGAAIDVETFKETEDPEDEPPLFWMDLPDAPAVDKKGGRS